MMGSGPAFLVGTNFFCKCKKLPQPDFVGIDEFLLNKTVNKTAQTLPAKLNKPSNELLQLMTEFNYSSYDIFARLYFSWSVVLILQIHLKVLENSI